MTFCIFSQCPLKMKLKCAVGAATIYSLGIASHMLYQTYYPNGCSRFCKKVSTLKNIDSQVYCDNCKTLYNNDTNKCLCDD